MANPLNLISARQDAIKIEKFHMGLTLYHRPATNQRDIMYLIMQQELQLLLEPKHQFYKKGAFPCMWQAVQLPIEIGNLPTGAMRK